MSHIKTELFQMLVLSSV